MLQKIAVRRYWFSHVFFVVTAATTPTAFLNANPHVPASQGTRVDSHQGEPSQYRPQALKRSWLTGLAVGSALFISATIGFAMYKKSSQSVPVVHQEDYPQEIVDMIEKAFKEKGDLGICGKPGLKSIPPSIGDLTHLHDLNLSALVIL